MPTVTWLLNVRNGMPHLPATLASIEAQSFKDYEVLAWVMESDDGTEGELAKWIPGRLPGRVFKSGAIPLGEARAELVRQVQSEFCACIDADDVNEPNRLAEQVAFLRKHPEIALVGSRLRVIDENNRVTGETYDYPLSHEEIVNTFIRENAIGQPSVLFRREAVLAAGNYYFSKSTEVIEDFDLWLRLAANHRLANLPDYLVKYRKHSASLTRTLIAKGVHDQRLDHTFAQNAPPLFGISTEEAGRLRSHNDSCTFIRACKIARYRARRQGGPVLAQLRNPSLIENLRPLTSPHDVLSRLLLAMLDKNASLVSESRAVLRDGILKIPFFKPAVEAIQNFRGRRRFFKWVKSQNSRGAKLSQGMEFTGRYEGYKVMTVSPGVIIDREVTFWISNEPGAKPEIHLGPRAYIGKGSFLGVHQPIYIGENVLIGPYCYIATSNHNFSRRDIPIIDQGFTGAPVRIEDDVWFGTHVVAMPGVTIGRGAIVGAGSVVTSSIPPYEIWGGTPARFIKQRP